MPVLWTKMNKISITKFHDVPQIPILAVSKTFQSITHKTLCILGSKPQSNTIAINFVDIKKKTGPRKKKLSRVEILIELPHLPFTSLWGLRKQILEAGAPLLALNQV